jgi:hypothetical protein
MFNLEKAADLTKYEDDDLMYDWDSLISKSRKIASLLFEFAQFE